MLQVWVIRETNEVFPDYELYLQRSVQASPFEGMNQPDAPQDGLLQTGQHTCLALLVP
jgi:hypothetical protein